MQPQYASRNCNCVALYSSFCNCRICLLGDFQNAEQISACIQHVEMLSVTHKMLFAAAELSLFRQYEASADMGAYIAAV